MKIAVTSEGPDLDSRVDPRFGRCAYFVFVESEGLAFEALENGNVSLGGGAGIQSGQLVSDKGAKVVLTGNVGPNAYRTLEAAGIQVVIGASGTVRQAVEAYTAGRLSAPGGANVQSHFGVGAAGPGAPSGLGQGAGRGMGGGMGMGRGGGRGMGRGMGMGAPAVPGMQGGGGALVALVDAKLCDACRRCVDVCETEAIAVDGVARIDRARCTGCTRCVTACPRGAISMHKA